MSYIYDTAFAVTHKRNDKDYGGMKYKPLVAERLAMNLVSDPKKRNIIRRLEFIARSYKYPGWLQAIAKDMKRREKESLETEKNVKS